MEASTPTAPTGFINMTPSTRSLPANASGPMASPFAGQQFEYGVDDIGNRQSAIQPSATLRYQPGTACIPNHRDCGHQPRGFNRFLRACLKTPGNRRVRARGLQDLAEEPVACRPGALTGRGDRRVRARGLQDLAEKPVACRPGALTGRVFKHALSKAVGGWKPRINTDKHGAKPLFAAALTG